MSLIIN
ncbi:uncharacterized protein FFM5_15130 [Fusarium fujikuroi]|nr:uncharacterized protein FFM5_15130 [Fusarium fujikuroi]